MNHEDFNKIIEKQLADCEKVLCNKALEYATSDRLHNFKVAATVQGLTPRQALAGMMAKHTVSIFDMCMSTHEYPPSMWDEKITDHINYLLLLKAVVAENT